MSDKIIQTTCRKWNVTYEEVIGRCRRPPLPFIRMTIAYFLREYTNLSTTEIGKLIGRDHTTVIHYLKIYKYEFRFNDIFRSFAQSIEAELNEEVRTSFLLEMEEEFNEIYG